MVIKQIMIFLLGLLSIPLAAQQSNFGIMVEHTSFMIDTDYKDWNDGVTEVYSESKVFSGNYEFSFSFKIPLSENYKLEIRPGYLASNTHLSSCLNLGFYIRGKINSDFFIAPGLSTGLIGFGEGAHGISNYYGPVPGLRVFVIAAMGYFLTENFALIISAGKQVNEMYLTGTITDRIHTDLKYTRYLKWTFKLGVEYNFPSEN